MKNIALVTALISCNVFAQDIAGFEVNGYGRGGPVLNYDRQNNVRGNLSLGGDLQKFRLGNEGDNYLEINIARTVDTDGIRAKLDYMPSKTDNGNIVSEQVYVEFSGLDFAPEAGVWVGQRRNRINDIHILDHYLMDYSGGKGAGVNDINLGMAKAGFAVYTADSIDKPLPAGVSASRFNAYVSDIETNQDGKLQVLLNFVSGSGLGATSNNGSGISVSHNQTNLGASGVNNTVWIQVSTGHANVDGGFLNIDATSGGQHTSRIADAVDWQRGPFGGQALFGCQRYRGDLPGANTTTDFSLGGRVSYAFSKHYKLLAEAGTTSRRIDGAPEQTLNKFTLAPTIALNPDFWSRPELRLYVTKANWNTAAATANSGSFGAGGKTSQVLAGVQFEIWW